MENNPDVFDSDPPRSIRRVLTRLGYGEVRRVGTSAWRATTDLSGRYGTTDDTRVKMPGAGEEHARLICTETSETVGHARRSDPD